MIFLGFLMFIFLIFIVFQIFASHKEEKTKEKKVQVSVRPCSVIRYLLLFGGNLPAVFIMAGIRVQ